MRTSSENSAIKKGFNAAVADTVNRYLARIAESSTKVSPLPTIYEPQYPLELLTEGRDKE